MGISILTPFFKMDGQFPSQKKVSRWIFHLDKKCHDRGGHLDSGPPQGPNPS